VMLVLDLPLLLDLTICIQVTLKGVVSDIASCDETNYMCVFWPFFGLPFFVFFCDGSDH
jgi:hypothetical protein